MRNNPYYPHICGRCVHWKSSGAGVRNAQGVKGYCHRMFLVTHDSGHCASFGEKEKPAKILEAAE